MPTGKFSPLKILKSDKVTILFAQPARLAKGQDVDILSEQTVAADAACIRDALISRGYNATCLSVGDNLGDFLPSLLGSQPHVVFNLAETVLGESALESSVPRLLDFLHFPYTGSGPAAIELCLDKMRTKMALHARAIPSPGWQVFESAAPQPFSLTFPVIVKPLREDGSIGIHAGSVVSDAVGLQRQVQWVLDNYRQPALVEAYVGEREFNVSILGNEDPLVLPLCEIDFSSMPPEQPKIVSFRAKWNPESPEYRGSMPQCPAAISEALQRKIEAIALEAYNACGVRDYGRVDLRWDGQNDPVVIDVNPNPAISLDTGFVLSAQKGGLDYAEMLEKIVDYALQRSAPEP